MRKTSINIFILFTTLFFSVGCSKDSDTISSGIIATDLIKIEDALHHTNTNFVNLVTSIRGSVGTSGTGSKVIWSKKNSYNLGLFVSANHVFGIDSWLTLNEEFIDLTTINNGLFLGSKIPPTNGSPILTNELIASFGLYHPQIPSNATNSSLLPEHDFYIGIVDNQRVIDNGFGNYPTLVQTGIPLQLFDPSLRTLANLTWSEAHAGNHAIAIGYPQDRARFPNGAVATGNIYSDEEAENIILKLDQNNDPEGAIPYNPNVEFIANIDAVAGMSGGGVFNTNGQLLGIMVRATALNGQPVLRVVRMSFIVQKLEIFYNSLSVADKNKMGPFISGELN